MSKNETGEFELVLGNRQLLSGFAVVVILFGVFFAMGYIVGRNSAPAVRMASTPGAVTAGTPAAQQQAPAPVALPSAAKPADTPSSTASSQPFATQPAADTPSQTGTRPAQDSSGSENPVSTQSARLIQPQPGQTYLQVMAVRQPDAEVVIKTLRDKGFAAVMAASPKEGIFRVLVGPFQDNNTLAQAKSDLENAGFHPFVQR